jgi:hypothetical protein
MLASAASSSSYAPLSRRTHARSHALAVRHVLPLHPRTRACLPSYSSLWRSLTSAQLYIGEAIWAFAFGVIIGPYGAGIFDPRAWGGGARDTTQLITLEFTRVVLAIGVFAVGVELPKQYMKRHWKSLFFLLVPVMTWVRAALTLSSVPCGC